MRRTARQGRSGGKAIGQAEGNTLRAFVRENTERGAQFYTDGHRAYWALDGEYKHKFVEHGVGTYVIEQAHTKGIESFWSMLKRGYQGTYHQMSEKQLDRSINEFSGRNNGRPLDTEDQMTALAEATAGKRLSYRELTA